MKTGKRIMLLLAGLLLAVSLTAYGSIARAQEIDMVLMEIHEAVQVRESDEADSPVVAELEAGTPVIAIMEGNNHTVKIQYQEITGYIPRTAAGIYGEENLEAIAQEQREEEAVNFRAMEEYEAEQENRKGSLILGGLIALIVVAVFGFGIVTALKQEKKKEE